MIVQIQPDHLKVYNQFLSMEYMSKCSTILDTHSDIKSQLMLCIHF